MIPRLISKKTQATNDGTIPHSQNLDTDSQSN